MTDHGTTATYRRIGDHDDAGDGTRPLPGLRRISEPPGAPAAPGAPTPPTTTERAGAGEPAGDWTVPHPDDLEAPAGRTEGAGAEGVGAEEVEAGERPARRARSEARPKAASVAAAPARGPRRALVAVSVAAVVLLAAVVVLGVLLINRGNTDSLRSSALSAARTDGVLLSSYDYRNLTGPGSDWAKVEAASTPTFRKNFLSTSADLGKLLTQYNATATGKVLVDGVASLSGNRAVVLLFIDQTVSNTAQKGQSSTQPLRSELTLVRQGGKWLIDDLQVPK